MCVVPSTQLPPRPLDVRISRAHVSKASGLVERAYLTSMLASVGQGSISITTAARDMGPQCAHADGISQCLLPSGTHTVTATSVQSRPTSAPYAVCLLTTFTATDAVPTFDGKADTTWHCGRWYLLPNAFQSSANIYLPNVLGHPSYRTTLRRTPLVMATPLSSSPNILASRWGDMPTLENTFGAWMICASIGCM